MAEEFEPISDDQLVSKIYEELTSANYEADARLIEQRSEADLAYTGQYTPGTEPNTGMSSILINVIQPAVDTLTTYLSNIFTSDKETVIFSARNEENTQVARDLTTLINSKIHQQNNGYFILNRWIKDSLLHKTGIVKVVWDDTPEYYKYQFRGKEEELAAELLKKEEDGYECSVTEKKIVTTTLSIVDKTTDETIEVANEEYECFVRCEKPRNQPRLVNVPPEEFYINEGARSIDDIHTRFVAQQQLLTVSDVLEQFPDADPDDLVGSYGFLTDEYETAARHAFDGTFDYHQDAPSTGATRLVAVIEAWIRVDMNGNGVADWHHVFLCGHTLLQNDEWFGPIPMCSYSPVPVPFKFYGLGLWDKLRDYQRTKTGLVRAAIDSSNNKNIIRYFGDPRNIDARGLKSGKPGLIAVTPGFDAKSLVPVPTSTGSPNDSVSLLQYLDKEIIAQIGIDPVSGMVSNDVEKSGNDAAKTAQVVDNASAKVEAMARELAETGLKDLIWIVYDMMIQQGTIPDMGFEKSDLSAKVGLGHQTMQQKLHSAQTIIAQQGNLENSQVNPVILPAAKKLAASKYLAKSLGEMDPDQFFPTAEEVAQEKAQAAEAAAAKEEEAKQIAMQQLQLDMADKQSMIMERQAKTQKVTVEAENVVQSQQLEEERVAATLLNSQADNDREEMRMMDQDDQMSSNQMNQQGKIELEREKLYVKADTDLEIAKIKAGASSGEEQEYPR